MSQDKNKKYKDYFFEIGGILKERGLKIAKEVREERERRRKGIYENDLEYQFKAGRLHAFYFVIDWMLDNVEACSIPLKDLQFEDIDPDRDLIFRGYLY